MIDYLQIFKDGFQFRSVPLLAPPPYSPLLHLYILQLRCVCVYNFLFYNLAFYLMLYMVDGGPSEMIGRAVQCFSNDVSYIDRLIR